MKNSFIQQILFSLLVLCLSAVATAQQASNPNQFSQKENGVSVFEVHSMIQPDKIKHHPHMPFSLICLKVEQGDQQDCLLVSKGTCDYVLSRYEDVRWKDKNSVDVQSSVAFSAYANYWNYDPPNGLSSVNTGRFPIDMEPYVQHMASQIKTDSKNLKFTWPRSYIDNPETQNKEIFAKAAGDYITQCGRFIGEETAQGMLRRFNEQAQPARSDQPNHRRPRATQ